MSTRPMQIDYFIYSTVLSIYREIAIDSNMQNSLANRRNWNREFISFLFHTDKLFNSLGPIIRIRVDAFCGYP